MSWYPHVTVAAVAEREGRYLCVEETIAGQRVINQPAGHLEAGESLAAAVKRETLEETGWEFEPLGLVGIYRWEAPSGTSFLRFTFHGRLLRQLAEHPLDADIDAAGWWSATELAGAAQRLRSPLVLQCVRDYEAGQRYPLTLLRDLGGA